MQGFLQIPGAYTPKVGPELSLNQPNEEEKRRYQTITGAVVCLTQVTRYDILYAANYLARVMSKPAKGHIGAAFATWPGPQIDVSITPTSRAALGVQ